MSARQACIAVAGVLIAGFSDAACVIAQPVQYNIGPRALYNAPRSTARDSVPLVMRDAIKKLTVGSRLLAAGPRIVGGEPAVAGAFPWVASIGMKGVMQKDSHFCGGAFIAPQWVVTAAHCINPSAAGGLQVLAGTITLSEGGSTHVVDRAIVHENYDPETSDYDIALLHVTTPFRGPPIRLIDAAEAARIARPGDAAIVAGWGLTAEDGDISNVLRRVSVQFVSNKACNGLASYGGAITERMICAGFPEGGKDSCQGDSGGPLMVADATRSYRLAGVVSFGEGCARPNKFGVYASIAVFEPWIAAQVSGRAAPVANNSRPASETSTVRTRNGVFVNTRAQAPARKNVRTKRTIRRPANTR